MTQNEKDVLTVMVVFTVCILIASISWEAMVTLNMPLDLSVQFPY